MAVDSFIVGKMQQRLTKQFVYVVVCGEFKITIKFESIIMKGDSQLMK